ncbi:hypothetical protein G4D82_02515 [Flavobacterium sp. CYK-4]|uniref:DUF5689 domain-containing protein n=1 Tax=Flavobacterium lotistagni TaxID=2709660 RepID=UPI00140CA8EE|nr:DUF5689 domain-containing protein [Flavobacterium lotistagni]NHM06082.1 hypothetical protein [Flavobacterium lotistagni]
MKTRLIKSLTVFSMLLVLSTSCVKDDSNMDNSETGIVTYELTANKTVQDIITFNNTANPVQYTADDIIEAYVTSTDETGTFYNTICLQNIATNSSQPIGLSVTANFSSYVKGFTPGRKIYIKMQGLYTAVVDGSLKIGALFEGEIGRISENEWQNFLFPSATIVDEDNMVRTMSLATAANNTNLNTLIEIDNVQFADSSLGRTLFDIDSGGSATNHDITDVNGGTTRFFRVSSFALFAYQPVPSGRGKLRGVMTKYGSDFQFLVRHQNDIKLTNPRTYTFNSTLNENFESYDTNLKSFVKYLNFDISGAKNWIVKSVNSTKCIQMSSFGGDLQSNKTYFVVPVDFTAANTFTFSIDTDFFSTGLGLKVYRSTDYVPGEKITNATLNDITSNFTLPTETTSAFVSAGIYNFPTNLTGNGYVIFEYTGSNISGPTLLTTNVNIDNIVIN